MSRILSVNMGKALSDEPNTKAISALMNCFVLAICAINCCQDVHIILFKTEATGMFDMFDEI